LDRFRLLCVASALALAVTACGGRDEETTGDSPTDNAGEQNAGVVASNVPALKPGLWRVTVIAETGPQFPAELICLTEAEAKGKQGLGERAAALPCDERQVTVENKAVVTRAVCNVGGIKRTIVSSAAGDFQADYWINYVENLDPPPADAPAEIKRRIHSRWMGECKGQGGRGAG
jgi:hypothetical protein